MNNIDDTDKELTERWYHYAAKQVGFVGQALTLVRIYTGQTEKEQRLELCGTDVSSFIHLQGMPRPRPQTLVVDANHIAEECGITNPLAFVRAIILAHKIEGSQLSPMEETCYQAAFDECEDLDLYPEKE